MLRELCLNIKYLDLQILLGCPSIIQKVHYYILIADLLIYFTSFYSNFGIYFTFPSQYLFTIAYIIYLNSKMVFRQSNNIIRYCFTFISIFYFIIRFLTNKKFDHIIFITNLNIYFYSVRSQLLTISQLIYLIAIESIHFANF